MIKIPTEAKTDGPSLGGGCQNQTFCLRRKMWYSRALSFWNWTEFDVKKTWIIKSIKAVLTTGCANYGTWSIRLESINHWTTKTLRMHLTTTFWPPYIETFFQKKYRKWNFLFLSMLFRAFSACLAWVWYPYGTFREA